jgi:hypothetical protein
MNPFLRVVKEREGFSWYESEVHPAVVSKLLKRPMWGRSYMMHPEDYRAWLDFTRMDMIYGYVPWHYGRKNEEDEWGRFVYKGPDAKIGDYVPCAPIDFLNRRMNELFSIKDHEGMEWAVYNTPNLVVDALGLEGFCFAMNDVPDKLMDWMKFIDEEVRGELNTILDKPVDVVRVSQYLADKNGQLFNDEQMERFNLSFLRERVKQIHDSHRLVSLHCDGSCEKLYGKFADIGIDIFNSYDGKDQVKDVGEWGNRFTFHGSIPMDLLENGEPQSIKLLVEAYKTALGPHIISSRHDVGNVPVENFVAMMESARDSSRTA